MLSALSETLQNNVVATVEAKRRDLARVCSELIQINTENPPGDCSGVVDYLEKHLSRVRRSIFEDLSRQKFAEGKRTRSSQGKFRRIDRTLGEEQSRIVNRNSHGCRSGGRAEHVDVSAFLWKNLWGQDLGTRSLRRKVLTRSPALCYTCPN